MHLTDPDQICVQVQRLVAVLTVKGVSRSNLLEDSTPVLHEKLSADERAVLEEAGWREGATIKSLLNFSGDAYMGGLAQGSTSSLRAAWYVQALAMHQQWLQLLWAVVPAEAPQLLLPIGT